MPQSRSIAQATTFLTRQRKIGVFNGHISMTKMKFQYKPLITSRSNGPKMFNPLAYNTSRRKPIEVVFNPTETRLANEQIMKGKKGFFSIPYRKNLNYIF